MYQTNTAVARLALREEEALMFIIPPHRSDLNPIENLFQLLPKPLRKDAHDRPITSSKFSVRVVKRS